MSDVTAKSGSMIKAMGVLLSLMLFTAMTGCSQVEPTTPHDPTTADQVKIYKDEPSKYQILGTLRVAVSPSVHWDERGNADAGFEQLKSAAAAEGATGILLLAPKGEADAKATVGYHGTYYQVPVKTDPRTAIVQAIYVVKS